VVLTGMETEEMEKQIDEMAKDIDDSMEFDDVYGEYILDFEHIAMQLSKLGYRKIPEGAVVLTKEEYKKWLEFVISYLILFVCEHCRGLGEDPLWQPNEDEREKIPLDLDNMFKKITEGK
jgi:hypothetical protein